MPSSIPELRRIIANELVNSIIDNNEYKLKEDNQYDVPFASITTFGIQLRKQMHRGGVRGNNLCLLALSNRFSYKIVIFSTLTKNVIIYGKDHANTLYFGYNHEEEEYCAFIDKSCENNKINNKWIINNENRQIKKDKNNNKSKKTISLLDNKNKNDSKESNKLLSPRKKSQDNVVEIVEESSTNVNNDIFFFHAESQFYFIKSNIRMNMSDSTCVNEICERNNFWDFNLRADGDCFFHGLVLFASLNNWTDIPLDVSALRNEAANEMIENSYKYSPVYIHGDYSDYAERVRLTSRNGGPHASDIVISSLCNKYGLNLVVFKRTMDVPFIHRAGTRKCIFYLTQPNEEQDSIEAETGSDHYHALIDKSEFSASALKEFRFGSIDNDMHGRFRSDVCVSITRKKRKTDNNNNKNNQTTLDSFLTDKNQSKNYYEILSIDDDEDDEDHNNNMHVDITNECTEESFNKLLKSSHEDFSRK